MKTIFTLSVVCDDGSKRLLEEREFFELHHDEPHLEAYLKGLLKAAADFAQESLSGPMARVAQDLGMRVLLSEKEVPR